MSHRVFDELAHLRRRLAALDIDIAGARKARVVDFGKLADLRNTRETLLEQIAAKEASIHADA